MTEQGVPAARRQRLLERADLPWLLPLMLVALGLRLLYFSGFGLDDDLIFKGNTAFVVNSQRLSGDNICYRLTWLILSAISCKIFGLTEVGLIFPITTMATLAIALIFAFGKSLWGRAGGLIAALLLTVHPLDFAWSTMVSNDITVSLFSALALLLLLRALEQQDRVWKCRLFILAALTFWLACQAKISAILLLPAMACVLWTHRHRLDAQVADFVVTMAVLFGVTGLIYYLFTGDPLAPYHTELKYQVLTGPDALRRRLTAEVFWTYPKLLFYPDHLGDLLFSLYPHLLVVLAVAGPLLGISTSIDVFWWFLFVFLGMQFNIQRGQGVWVAGFRNIRHEHVFVYPLILLLTGYLVALRSKWPRTTAAILGLLLVFSTWQSIATASKTHAAFGDMRAACWFLASLPQKHIYTDAKLVPSWCTSLNVSGGWKFTALHSWDRTRRSKEIAAVKSGYLVTGGGREPYYGCLDCIVSADELPPGKWRLLKEFPGPAKPTPWRREPLRVWEAVETPGAD